MPETKFDKFDLHGMILRYQKQYGVPYHQSAFTVVWNVWPEIAGDLRNGPLDPRENPEILKDFLEEVVSRVTDVEILDEEE